MFFRTFWIDGLAQASYMVGERDGRVAVIDPIRDVDIYLDAARQEGVSIAAVLETHIHADFVSGARELAERSGARLYLSAEGGREWQYAFPHEPLRDTDAFELGSYRLTAVHTPGHTPEHLIYLLADTTRSAEPWLAFSGDLLFVGDVGRPDLLGEAEARTLAERLYDSIHRKLLPLPDGLEVYPGHGEGSLCGRSLGSKRSTTLGYERRFNYALQPMTKEEFLRKVIEGQPPAPPYFPRMKQINKEGPTALGALAAPRALPAARVRELVEGGAVVIDARSKEAFGGAHIPGSYAVPRDNFFATWVGYIVPPDRPIVLVLESPAEWSTAVRQLARVGYDCIAGFLENGMAGWGLAGYGVQALAQMPASELKRRLDAGEKILVLDVRTDSEWRAERYPHALHIHAGYLPERWRELEKARGVSEDTAVAVVCRSGHRSTIAASILQQHGFTNIASVPGGMIAWREAGGLISGDADLACASRAG
jgi:hydroxyacylglutathione hydrolase